MVDIKKVARKIGKKVTHRNLEKVTKHGGNMLRKTGKTLEYTGNPYAMGVGAGMVETGAKTKAVSKLLKKQRKNKNKK